MFASLTLFLAVVLAAVFGDMNFWYNMQPFYDIENLNTYPSINPAVETGRLLVVLVWVSAVGVDSPGPPVPAAMGVNEDCICSSSSRIVVTMR